MILKLKRVASELCLSSLGMFLFWLTSVIPQARPPPCVASNNICRSVEVFQLFFLCFSLSIIAIGAGAIKSSSLAFGSDQLKREAYQGNACAMESYFSWYYAVYALSVLVSLTCLVYIQVNMGWALGFGAPVLLMLFSTLLIYLGTPFYVKLKPKTSLITGLFQVIVASYRNRCLRLLSQSADIQYHQKKGSATVLPSEKLRFLNKACIVQDPQLDLSPDGEATDPWRLCTVDQVAESIIQSCSNLVDGSCNVHKYKPELFSSTSSEYHGSTYWFKL